MLNKIVVSNKIIPRNIIFDKDNSINTQFKRSFIELLKDKNNLTYFEKYNFIGVNFINQFFIDSPVKFWNDILLNEQITTHVKDGIYYIITTKSFSRSLIFNSSGNNSWINRENITAGSTVPTRSNSVVTFLEPLARTITSPLTAWRIPSSIKTARDWEGVDGVVEERYIP